MPNSPDEKWYRDGLRFSCTRCGACCTGEPGFVWVDEREIAALAAFRGESSADFEKRYVREVGARRSLRERKNGDCVFYEAGVGCTVYPHRPKQCRTWPFWESNIESAGAWERTCRDCPGAGSGPLYTVEEIIAQAELIRL